MAECRKSLSLLEEEKLSETVRNFPVLYDKSHTGYKERDAVKNAWTEVANSLEFIEDWHDAKNSYEIFKKRYLKKRNLLRKTDKSGTSSASVEKAQRDFNPYQFFSWIDIYLRPRESKTNVIDLDTESICSPGPGSSNFILDEDEQDSDNESENNDKKETDIEEMESKPTKRKQSKSKEKVNKLRKLSMVDQKQIKLMEDIEREMLMEKELKQTAKVQDAEETYCINLACELRKFTEEEKCLIKHEINNVMFKYQMRRFNPHTPSFSGQITRVPGQSFHQGHPYS